jgi:serine/threonine-protein kinase
VAGGLYDGAHAQLDYGTDAPIVISGSSDLPPGTAVGPYQIESLLGVGGMGQVYRAANDAGQTVALKFVRRDLARDTVFRKRFEREARIAQQIIDPHVVPVLDTGDHDGIPYLAQRFIAGGSLQDRLRREGRLEVDVALRIAGQVAGGLGALADHGMVHRDVKPANVLLDEDGVALITDFGLAKDSKGTVLTRPGQALGSPHYMAPEQIRGEEVSSATDTYGLGCVLYECLGGQPPFAHERGIRVMWAQLSDTPPDPCADLAGARPGLGTAVLRALAKIPAERPASAREYVSLVYAAAGIDAPAGA